MAKTMLVQGDCLEIMKRIPDKSIDCIICDLPYGTTACKWDVLIPFDKLWEQYKRIRKDNIPIILFGSEPFSSYLRMSNIEEYKYDWYWNKNNATGFQLANCKPLKKIENIIVFSEGATYPTSTKKVPYNPQGLVIFNKKNKRGSKGQMLTESGCKVNEYIQKYSNYPVDLLVYSYDKSRFHPTQKPIGLLEYLVKTYTSKNQIVLDNCMGSGTTGVACKKLGRRFYGIELDKGYFEIAKKRIEETDEDKA